MANVSGKIAAGDFAKIVQQQCGRHRAEVRVGPAFGVDCAIIDLPGNMALAVTSDPLSLVPSIGLEASAWLSVHLMANDMATTGVAPQYGQFVLNLPSDFSREDFAQYWKYIHQFCDQIGVAITGGHTGFIEDQHSTIAGGGSLFAVAPKTELLTSSKAQPGDVIIITKSAALLSSAILALSFPETTRNSIGRELHTAASEAFYNCSSLADAKIAITSCFHRSLISAMHDVTEGGVLGAVYEMAVASGNGAMIDAAAIPVGSPQQAVCTLFDIDPLYSIGAGAMIIACKQEGVKSIIGNLQQEHIQATAIGHFCPANQGINIIQNGQSRDLVYQSTDPYWAAFFKAYQEGWK